VLEGHEYGKAADIFSLAFIMWELWYGRRAHVDMTAILIGNDIDTAIRKGLRPSLVSIYEPLDELKDLISKCWSQGYKHRPTADECLQFFMKQSKRLE
jgi:hypothetical protein